MQSDPTFAELMDIADLLTPYAVAFRYPGDVLEPTMEDTREALDSAGKVLEYVLARLPGDAIS